MSDRWTEVKQSFKLGTKIGRRNLKSKKGSTSSIAEAVAPDYFFGRNMEAARQVRKRAALLGMDIPDPPELTDYPVLAALKAGLVDKQQAMREVGMLGELAALTRP